jgi:hypothetical protein
MLFIAERAAELPAISSSKLPPLCAIALALDSARTVANVIVETFIVNFSLWSVNDSKPYRRFRFCSRQSNCEDDGGTMILPSGLSVN